MVRFPRPPRAAACGALGVQMNLFSRLFRVARSYANALGRILLSLATTHGAQAQHIMQLLNHTQQEKCLYASVEQNRSCMDGVISLYLCASDNMSWWHRTRLPAVRLCAFAVSSVEDPEKMLDQTVSEMQNDLIKMRQASAQVRLSCTRVFIS